MAVKDMISRLTRFIEAPSEIRAKAGHILLKFAKKDYPYLLSNILEVNAFQTRKDTLACLHTALTQDWGRKRRKAWQQDREKARLQEHIADLRAQFHQYLEEMRDNRQEKAYLHRVSQAIRSSSDASYFINYPHLESLMRVNLPPHLQGLQIIYMKYFKALSVGLFA